MIDLRSSDTPPVALPWNVLLARADLVPDDCLLDVEQTAEALGFSKAAIYARTSRWRREHTATVPLPHLRVAGGLRFAVGALRRWVAANSVSRLPRQPDAVQLVTRDKPPLAGGAAPD